VAGNASSVFFPIVARFEEKDANLIAIDPGELEAPVRVSHRRKQQEQFLEGKTFDRAVDGQSSAGLRYILHGAGPPPSTVDGHHVGGKSPLEYDTLCLPQFHLNQTVKLKNEVIEWKTRRVCGGFSIRNTLAGSWGISAMPRT